MQLGIMAFLLAVFVGIPLGSCRARAQQVAGLPVDRDLRHRDATQLVLEPPA
jgi:hypothetical protein